MNFSKRIEKSGNNAFPYYLIHDILKDYKRPNDKIAELIKKGELISIRRGLYIPGRESYLAAPSPLLIANQLRGPSYVSFESAFAFWNMIPERVFEITSATLKTSKKYETAIGRFNYFHLPSPYYSFGIKSIRLSENQTVLIASPEKAICDKIVLTSGIQLRSKNQTKKLLLEDLRLELSFLQNLDLKSIHSWIKESPKKSSLDILLKTLIEL